MAVLAEGGAKYPVVQEAKFLDEIQTNSEGVVAANLAIESEPLLIGAESLYFCALYFCTTYCVQEKGTKVTSLN